MSNLIERQSAIDEWKNDFKGYVNSINIPRDDYNGIMEYIDELPSAEPEQRWIPVTERLPEKGEKVLASTKNTIFTQVFKGVQGTSDSWWWNNNTIKTIYAWMPLPEPYTEREKDE